MFMLRISRFNPVNIEDLVAAQAVKVVVVFRYRVIAYRILAHRADHIHQTQFLEAVEGVIHRRQRGLGHRFAEDLVDVLGFWVLLAAKENIQNFPALGGDAASVLFELGDDLFHNFQLV